MSLEGNAFKSVHLILDKMRVFLVLGCSHICLVFNKCASPLRLQADSSVCFFHTEVGIPSVFSLIFCSLPSIFHLPVFVGGVTYHSTGNQAVCLQSDKTDSNGNVRREEAAKNTEEEVFWKYCHFVFYW